jgi:UDP-2-acetamido-2,6-beta-L-arabino-hexul-4-ose reductase
MPVTIDKLKIIADERGVVFEPLSADCLPDQKNVHVVINQPGAVRANHYHLAGTETVVVEGQSLVRIQEGNKIRDIVVSSREVYRFIIPAKTPHAIKNIGDQPNVLIAFNTVSHDPDKPAIVQKVLIE